MIRVLNKAHHFTFSEHVDYIGRPSPLGNPFKIGPDGDRDEVIKKYRGWLENRLTCPAFQGTAPVKEFDRLCDKYEREGTLTLMCWCAPLSCHGNVLADMIERARHV